MLPCKNDPISSYKGTEPSPKGLGYCAHAEKVGTKKKGRNGKIWIVKLIAGKTKRWIPYKDVVNKKDKVKDKNKNTGETKYKCKDIVQFVKSKERKTKKGIFIVSDIIFGVESRPGYYIKYNDIRKTFSKIERKIPRDYKKISIKSSVCKYFCRDEKK